MDPIRELIAILLDAAGEAITAAAEAADLRARLREWWWVIRHPEIVKA
jgi:hypothetical protein